MQLFISIPQKNAPVRLLHERHVLDIERDLRDLDELRKDISRMRITHRVQIRGFTVQVADELLGELRADQLNGLVEERKRITWSKKNIYTFEIWLFERNTL